MGNHSSSPSVSSLHQLQTQPVDNFESWAYWSRLSRLPCFRRTPMDDAHFDTVLVFLQMGNFTSADGSLRIYHPVELMYAGGSLEECRCRITAFVKLVINILIGDNATMAPADEKLLLKALKALVGNKTWDLHGQDESVFLFIQELAKSKLEDIALRGEEELFPKFRGEFADIKMPPRAKHRLDGAHVLPFKSLRTYLVSSIAGIPPHDHEFMVILEYLAKLIDPFFQFEARAIAEAHNGQWKAAPPKSCVRMAAKLTLDHAHEPWPQAAANIDMSRCAMTFSEAEDLRNAYEHCVARSELALLRTKNKLDDSFDAVNRSFGYRSLLSNMLLKLPVKWKDLIEADKSGFLPQLFTIGQQVLTTADGIVGAIAGYHKGFVRLRYAHGSKRGPKKLTAYHLIELNQAMVSEAMEEWRRVVPQSLKHIKDLDHLITRLQFSLFTNKAFLSAQARFIVEIQFLLTDYLKMRKRSHIWYKLYRTDVIDNLVSDFYSYSGINRASSFLLEALKQRDAQVLRYFCRLRDLPYSQVYLSSEGVEAAAAHSPRVKVSGVRMMRDNDTGNTVLHYFASAADRRGRYNILLQRILALEEVDIEALDNEYRTAYTVAKQCGSNLVQQMIAGHPNFGARCILNLFYHECGGEQWQIAAPSRNNSIALSGNHSESIGHHGPASRGTHAAASSSLSSLLPLFSLDGPPGHHRRTPSNSSVSSASSEDSFYEEPTLVDINENLGTCNDGSSGRVARGDSSASDVDISKPGGSRNISAPMLRDITTNPSQVTKRTMSAPAPHRTSSSLRRAPMSRTFSFSPNLKRHFLARSLSNPRTHPDDPADGWLTAIPVGEWRGVSVKDPLSETVVKLHLCCNNLAGQLPSELGRLSELRSLKLADNKLHGAIPTEFGRLQSLKVLDLSCNQLTGAVPAQLKHCRRLEILDVSHNSLQGPLPNHLCSGAWSATLKELVLNDNQLTGSLPTDIDKLKALTTLMLHNNNFRGEVPVDALVSSKNLSDLCLSNLELESLTDSITQLQDQLPRCRIHEIPSSTTQSRIEFKDCSDNVAETARHDSLP